jgi:hypothetical protein
MPKAYTPLDSSDGSVSLSKRRGETRLEADQINVVDTLVVTSGDMLDPPAAELLSVWKGLDDAARQDLLAIARGLAATCQNKGTAGNGR